MKCFKFKNDQMEKMFQLFIKMYIYIIFIFNIYITLHLSENFSK